jgi:hypothetical protein
MKNLWTSGQSKSIFGRLKKKKIKMSTGTVGYTGTVLSTSFCEAKSVANMLRGSKEGRLKNPVVGSKEINFVYLNF